MYAFVIYHQESDRRGNPYRDSMDSRALVQQSNGVSAEGYKRAVCGGGRCICLPSSRQRKISLLCGTSLVFDTLRGRDDSIVELLLYHTLNHRSLICTACTANNTHTCLYVSRHFLNTKESVLFSTDPFFALAEGVVWGRDYISLDGTLINVN